MRFVISVILAGSIFVPTLSFAQTATDIDQQYVARAMVLRVISNTYYGATSTPQSYHEIVEARIASGSERGKLIKFETYYTEGDGQKLNPEDLIYVTRLLQTDSSNDLAQVYSYHSLDHDRLPIVILFLLLFLGCIIYFGGRQGIRGLVSLLGGIGLIIFVLLPGVIHGYSPLLLSVVVASFVASLGAYITHGFSRMTTAAIMGMVCTIMGAAFLAQLAVHLGYLSGVTEESTFYLLNGKIDFQGLLLGGIIIGLLGVLYDAAIGQAVAVEELARAGPHLPRSFIYDRAYRMGREHIGALVNTLVLAYVGASLPMMISIFQSATGDFGGMSPILNWEFIATEVIRTTVGAMGLILTIPITTRIAVWMLVPERATADSQTIAKESKAVDQLGHLH